MNPRTSITHPLQIAEFTSPTAKGAIGVTFCPGKKQPGALTGAWDRDLCIDLDAIKAWGASTVITLIEFHEMESLEVSDIEQQTVARGMEWLHMPITDFSPPDQRFAQAWRKHGSRLLEEVRSGSRILVHCKGGLGRAGTVSALMLVELGMNPEDAMKAVRSARKGAIETREQEDYVRSSRGLRSAAEGQ
ncbi:cyclin-dependent kinase inhibitor 3 family protein [Aestuariivirga litoralis]|nr:cyclin-dependent kinase inhibitor 3 family protein [Aestuariivirga litoralis]